MLKKKNENLALDDPTWMSIKKRADEICLKLIAYYDMADDKPYIIKIYGDDRLLRKYAGEYWFPYEPVSAYVDAMEDIGCEIYGG